MQKIDAHYAHGEEYAGVETVIRFSAVKRWHMLPTSAAQTLADHSGAVALLAFLVAGTCPQMWFGSAPTVAGLALLHDVPEVFTGDIPTTTKPWLDQKALHHAEISITPPVFTVYELQPHLRHMIKLCDLADTIRFIRMHGVGAIGHHAEAGLIQSYWDKIRARQADWPDAILWHVLQVTYFYVFEARVDSAGAALGPNEAALVADLARRQGDHTRSA